MSDQAAASVDDVGLTALAHLDHRYDVPHERQVYLGDADAGVVTARERQRHVGLRILTKVDRAVVMRARHGIAELGLVRDVDPAPDLVWVCPRDADLHVAGRVDLFKLGNSRHLTKQTPGVDPPLRKGAGIPGQLDGPTELGLDAFDKLADLGRSALGLLALNADKGGLVLPVEEPDLERAIG